MTPLLNAETVLQITKGNRYKFVSDKKLIAFEETLNPTQPLHNQIANRARLGTPLTYDPSSLELDDAGSLLRQENDKLLFFGQSNSCEPRDLLNARTNTGKLAKALTGQDVDIEEGNWR